MGRWEEVSVEVKGLSKEVKRKRGELPTKYPKMITKLSLINKGESSRESKKIHLIEALKTAFSFFMHVDYSLI